MDWLTPAFFGTALLYASVGFGGGSTYNALLSLAGFDYSSNSLNVSAQFTY